MMTGTANFPLRIPGRIVAALAKCAAEESMQNGVRRGLDYLRVSPYGTVNATSIDACDGSLAARIIVYGTCPPRRQFIHAGLLRRTRVADDVAFDDETVRVLRTLQGVRGHADLETEVVRHRYLDLPGGEQGSAWEAFDGVFVPQPYDRSDNAIGIGTAFVRGIEALVGMGAINIRMQTHGPKAPIRLSAMGKFRMPWVDDFGATDRQVDFDVEVAAMPVPQ